MPLNHLSPEDWWDAMANAARSVSALYCEDVLSLAAFQKALKEEQDFESARLGSLCLECEWSDSCTSLARGTTTHGKTR